MNPFKKRPLLFKYLFVSALVFLIPVVIGFSLSNFYVRIKKDDLIAEEVQNACRIILKIKADKSLDIDSSFRLFKEINPVFLSPESQLIRQKSKPGSPLCELSREHHIVEVYLGEDVYIQTAHKPPARAELYFNDYPPESYKIFRKHPLIFGFLLPEQLMSIILGIFLLIGYVLSILSSFLLFDKATTHGGKILEEIRSGNLKARFNVGHKGGLVHQFNLMADEIERLVEQLKKLESSRTKMLQELTHDLKTPVASQLNLLETIRDKQNQMSDAQKKDFLNAAISETAYFSRLVEDLLFISGVVQPNSIGTSHKVNLNETILKEVELFRRQDDIEIIFESPLQVTLVGDELLLKRLVRNSLDNAMSFARSKIYISLEEKSDHYSLQVIDDGTGISAAEAQSFGRKRQTRRFSDEQGGRISIGLGSVIMKKIAQLYGGDAVIEESTRGRYASGTTLTITLKK